MEITDYQFNGIPVFIYGLIGITTAILSYVTLASDSESSSSEEEYNNQEQVPVAVAEPIKEPEEQPQPQEQAPQEQPPQQEGQGIRSHRKTKSNSKKLKKHRNKTAYSGKK